MTYEFVLGELASSGRDWPYRGKPAWILSSRDLPKPKGGGDDTKIVDAPVPDLFDEMIAAAASMPLFERRLAGAMQLKGVLPRRNGMVELDYDVRD